MNLIGHKKIKKGGTKKDVYRGNNNGNSVYANVDSPFAVASRHAGPVVKLVLFLFAELKFFVYYQPV